MNWHNYNQSLEIKHLQQACKEMGVPLLKPVTHFNLMYSHFVFGPASARSYEIGVVGNNWLVGWLVGW